MTERWAELAAILEREAEIGQTPDEILEFKYRLGQVQQTRLNDLDAAIARLPRGPQRGARARRRRCEALEGLFARGIKQLEIGEILEPLYRAVGRVGEARRRPRGAARAHSTGAERRAPRRCTTASPSSSKSKLIDAGAHARRLHPRAQGVPARREVGRGGRRASPARSTAAGRRSPTRTPTSSACTATRPSSAAIGKSPRARRSRTSSATSTRPVETYRYVLGGRAARRRGARQPRSHLPLDRAVGRARRHPRAAREGAGRDARARPSSTRASARSTRRGSRDVPNAIARVPPRSSTVSTRRTTAPSRRSRASTRAEERWTELNGVYERELENASGDVAEAEIRAKLAHLAADRLNDIRRARSTPGSACSTCAARIPEALGALANLYEQQQQWAELVRRARASVRHRGERRRRA